MLNSWFIFFNGYYLYDIQWQHENLLAASTVIFKSCFLKLCLRSRYVEKVCFSRYSKDSSNFFSQVCLIFQGRFPESKNSKFYGCDIQIWAPRDLAQHFHLTMKWNVLGRSPRLSEIDWIEQCLCICYGIVWRKWH